MFPDQALLFVLVSGDGIALQEVILKSMTLRNLVGWFP